MNKKRRIPIVVSGISAIILIIGIILFRERMTLFDTVETDPLPFFAKYLFFASAAAFVLIFFSWGMIDRKSKALWVVYAAVAAAVLIFCSISVIQSFVLQREISSRDPGYQLTRISLKEFGETGDDEKEMIFYMGRDDCAACLDIHPKLREIARRYHIQVFYYNTLLDRDTNPSALREVLNKYDITTVPTILVIRGKDIIARFSDERAATDLENMLLSH